MKKNIKNMAYLLAIAIAMASFYYFILRRPAYTPHVDVFTFERNVDVDEGQPLVITNLVSKEGVRLTEIFNPSRRAFTPERQSRYGADRSNPMGGGIGLKVSFVIRDGDRAETKTFILPGWQQFEETRRNVRRDEVKEASIRLATAISQFTAPVSVQRSFGIALDITEGITPALAKRVRKIVNESGAIRLGANPKNTVTLSLYNITQSPYQGGREKPNLGSPTEIKTSLEWLLKERPAESRSSVLRGLIPILEEMSQSGGNSRLDIFTDGLENTDELSVYKKPELLEKNNWATMDGIAHLENLKLSGLTVHLHPLPAKSARHAEMMEKGLAFLADRLTRAGAVVKVEPF